MNFSQYRKPVFISIFIIGIISLLVYLFITHSYYEISVKSNESDVSAKLSYVATDGSEHSVRRIFGISMVPRSSDVIIASNNNQQTKKYIDNKTLLGVNKVGINLDSQRHVSKIGSNSLGCDGSTSEAFYFTYSCSGSTNDIFKYPNRTEGQYKNQLLDIEPNDKRFNTKLYKNGVIAIVPAAKSLFVQYLDPSDGAGASQALANKDSRSLVIYPSGSDDSFLVVDNSINSVTFFSSIEAKPVELEVTKDSVHTACSVNQKQVVCAVTSPKEDSKGDNEPHNPDNKEQSDNTKIIRYDVKSKVKKTLKTNSSVVTVCLVGDSIYSLEADEALYYYNSNNERSTIATGIKSIACNKNGGVYTNGKSIYRFSEGTAQLAFKEDRLSISNIQSSRGNVIFTAFVGNSSQPTAQTYIMTIEQVQYPRLESKLPYTEQDDIPILENDYDDDNIYIKPILSITSDKQLGATIIDEEALAATKRDIEKRLSEDGILERLNVVYYVN